MLEGPVYILPVCSPKSIQVNSWLMMLVFDLPCFGFFYVFDHRCPSALFENLQLIDLAVVARSLVHSFGAQFRTTAKATKATRPLQLTVNSGMESEKNEKRIKSLKKSKDGRFRLVQTIPKPLKANPEPWHATCTLAMIHSCQNSLPQGCGVNHLNLRQVGTATSQASFSQASLTINRFWI